jgi:hypothetical protein
MQKGMIHNRHSQKEDATRVAPRTTCRWAAAAAAITTQFVFMTQSPFRRRNLGLLVVRSAALSAHYEAQVHQKIDGGKTGHAVRLSGFRRNPAERGQV